MIVRPILFEKDATTFTTYGLGVLSDAISCLVTEERNGEFELEMVYPIGGYNYGQIKTDRIIVAKAKENGTRQAFRIYRIVSELAGQITVNARHISYQLNFIPVPDLTGTGTAQQMMGALKTAALDTCPFTFQSDIATSASYSVPPTSLRSALGGIEGSVLDRYGGEYEWDNWTVKLWQSRGADNGAKIEYAKNMTAFEQTNDIGDLITGVMAFWKGDDGNGNSVFVYSSPQVIQNAHAGDYAHGRTVVLDISGEFETEPTQAQVTTYATSYLAATTLAKVSEAITVDFVPLWHTQEYKYALQNHINLCDTVTIIYKALGVNVKRKVTKTVFNVLLDRFDSIELGGEADVSDTIADLGSESSEMDRRLASIEASLGSLAHVSDASSLFALTSHNISVTVSTGSYDSGTSSAITKAGYYPIGIVGIDGGGGGSTNAALVRFFLSDVSAGTCKVNWLIRALNNASITLTFKPTILWAKTS
jgi:phage minor structural protein